MSAKYYQCYFDTNEHEGYENYLAFESLVKNKRWCDLIEKYGDKLSGMIGGSLKQRSSEFHNKVEHYLDIDFALVKNNKSYCLNFDTFTSLDEFEVLKFLKSFGFKRLETELKNSSVGSVQYFLNDSEILDSESVDWKWIIPEPMTSQDSITENFHESETEESDISDTRLDLDPIFLGPTTRRLVVRVTLMVLGIIFIPYIWGKAICFIAILYLNARFLLRSRLTLSKSGFEKKDTAFSSSIITKLRDIESVRETTDEKIILMLEIKNRSGGPGLRNTSELNDEEFKKIIKKYCNSCLIPYKKLDQES